MAHAQQLVTIFGLPAHVLLVHAVVVLLPLSALCAAALAVRPAWRRRYGWPVLLLAAAAVGAVPLTQKAGEQLQAKLGALPNPLIQQHADLGGTLLPYAIGFLVAVVALVIAGKLADREHAAARRVAAGTTVVRAAGLGDEDEDGHGDELVHAAAVAAAAVPRAWRRITVVVAVLVIATAAATTVQVVRIGDSGARAVWTGVAGG
jgi:hypothetical protein